MPTSQIDPLTLGVVLAALGMGGTLVTLFLLSLVMDLLKRLFPAEPPAPQSPPAAPPNPPAPSPNPPSAAS